VPGFPQQISAFGSQRDGSSDKDTTLWAQTLVSHKEHLAFMGPRCLQRPWRFLRLMKNEHFLAQGQDL
jgi:hypothetical protein